jgi:hypothetical protein
MSQVLIIPADSGKAIYMRDAHGLQALQAIVDGYLQMMPYPDPRVAVYVNEHGQATKRQEPNLRATVLLFPPDLHAGFTVYGTAVLAGLDPDTGEQVDLPADAESRLMPTA